MAASWGAFLIGTFPPAVPTATGGSATGPLVDCPGGVMVVSVCGTFGGASIALNVLGPDGVTMIPAGAATTFTAAGMGVVYLAPCQIQMIVTGGPPSGIFASIARVVE